MLTLVLIFLSVLFLGAAVYYNVEYQRGQWIFSRRLSKYDREEMQVQQVKSDSFFTKLLEYLGSVAKPKGEELSNLQKSFLQAGFRKDVTLVFFGSKIGLAILLPIIFSIVKMVAFKTIPGLQVTMCVAVLVLIGFYLPNAWIKSRIARRKDQIFKSFPDALDLMVVCVEAGTSLDAAITRVGEELALGNKVLSNELKLLSLELRAGKSREEALRNLALRCDLDDINSLVTLLIQTDKFGTSVAQALRVYSDSMRSTRQQRAEEAAGKLPVKMVFPLALFIFPSLLIVVVGPAGIRIAKALVSIVHR